MHVSACKQVEANFMGFTKKSAAVQRSHGGRSDPGISLLAFASASSAASAGAWRMTAQTAHAK